MSLDSGRKPYPFAWNLIPLLGGVIDPFLGVLGKAAAIFWWPRLPRLSASALRRRRGLALVLGGIEGPSIYNYCIGMGLLKGRYRGAVERFDWNNGVFGVRSLVNLMSRRHHRTQAERLVGRIVAHAREHPGSPVCLVAQSGGCWIVVRALEMLPAGVQVDSAVLLAPSMSPGYDITAASEKCRRCLVSFGSLGDFFFLGIGTMLFGTSDRVWSPSAGLVGWHYHPRRFVESRWHPSWVGLGHIGNHVSSSASGFVARVIAPLFRSSEARNR